jgi:hypothetical protein
VPESEAKVAWGPCCFCGQLIESNSIEPCRLTVQTQRGGWQEWFCHAECFKSRITKLYDLKPGIF